MKKKKTLNAKIYQKLFSVKNLNFKVCSEQRFGKQGCNPTGVSIAGKHRGVFMAQPHSPTLKSFQNLSRLIYDDFRSLKNHLMVE